MRRVEEMMTALLGPARMQDLQLEGVIQLALENHAQVPFRRVHVLVCDRVATLTGNVDWRYQQNAAVAATKAVAGVREIVNRLTVTFTD
jgi:osmotically-inducible protein OsmY